MKDRIELVMKTFSLTPTEFSEKIGISLSVLSHIMSGRNNPSLDVVGKILRNFEEIDADWLILGKGKMQKESRLYPTLPSPQIIHNTQNQPTNPKIEEFGLFDTIEQPQSQVGTKLQKEVQAKREITPLKRERNEEKTIAIQTTNQSKEIVRITVFYSDQTYRNFVAE